MKTFLNQPIKPNTLGILYLCEYTHEPPSIKVVREIQFKSPFEALEAYSNIPNPESQMVSGNTQTKLFKELTSLHNNLNNPEWVKGLVDYL